MLSKSYYNPEVSLITQAQSQHLPQHPVHREFQHQIRDGQDEPEELVEGAVHASCEVTRALATEDLVRK